MLWSRLVHPKSVKLLTYQSDAQSCCRGARTPPTAVMLSARWYKSKPVHPTSSKSAGMLISLEAKKMYYA